MDPDFFLNNLNMKNVKNSRKTEQEKLTKLLQVEKGWGKFLLLFYNQSRPKLFHVNNNTNQSIYLCIFLERSVHRFYLLTFFYKVKQQKFDSFTRKVWRFKQSERLQIRAVECTEVKSETGKIVPSSGTPPQLYFSTSGSHSTPHS